LVACGSWRLLQQKGHPGRGAPFLGPALHHPRRPAAPAAGRAGQGPRRVADIVNIGSIAGRVAWNGYGVYSFTKFGVNGFTESLRRELTQRHVRAGLVEPGGAATELGSHNTPRSAPG
jgi:NAD(P)-dependent dehydrogenase (short-subunit alcohol dehydrogenase family)